jgi:uncharacterized protein (DUF2062 family)
MISWFITVLINVSLMGIEPPQGWIQGTVPFESKEVCELMVPVIEPMILTSIYNMTMGMGVVEEIRCMTEEEWIKRNEEHGHKKPKDLKMKDAPKPEGT